MKIRVSECDINVCHYLECPYNYGTQCDILDEPDLAEWGGEIVCIPNRDVIAAAEAIAQRAWGKEGSIDDSTT